MYSVKKKLVNNKFMVIKKNSLFKTILKCALGRETSLRDIFKDLLSQRQTGQGLPEE